jgi:hydroxypyruvate isomerase
LGGPNSVRNVIAENGVPNLITFSGNRNGMSEEQGADNCVAFLNKVKAQAEDTGVTSCMEHLNSKVNHKDYMFDHIAWGVDVMQRVNSPRVKILYDMYHPQIMDGDIVRNIRTHHEWIGHFHTGGNPGRNDIDESQARLSVHHASDRGSRLSGVRDA